MAEMQRTPLEQFVLEYVDAVGGAWDEAEPQVYEAMLPSDLTAALDLPEAGVHHLVFDPEALEDYPDSQLMVFGNTSLERIFEDARGRGIAARAYLPAGNLHPHDLRAQVARCLKLSDGLELSLGPARACHVHACVFWFEATFTSDEKEQDIIAVGIERLHGRPTRHLEEALRRYGVAAAPTLPYPDAKSVPMPQTYALARQEAISSLQVAAHARLTELDAGYRRQADRISGYFADSRAELAERARRALARGEAGERFDDQRRALDLEEETRLRELRQKLVLKVQVRLTNLLHVAQPKLMLELVVEPPKQAPRTLQAVWDPLAQMLEAIACPACGRPTLSLTARPSLGCPACAAAPGGQAQAKRHRT